MHSPPAPPPEPAPAAARPAAAGGSRRGLLPLVAVVVLVQLVAVAGLVSGHRTLFLRDVLTTHLPMKLAQAAAWRGGELPVLDPQRGGGQPSLGNPNSAPLHPSNLLYLLVPARHAFAAHFWLHFLLAPWAAAWLARRLGSPPGAAWAGGAVYASSGFFLSQLSYYNLVGGAAVAPAFVAACLAARDGGRRAAAAAGALWALLLVAGDPTLAALALVAAVLAVALGGRAGAGAAAPDGGSAGPSGRSGGGPAASPPPRAGSSPARPLVRLLLALALGSAVALPQLVELARALPTSVRGVRGFGEAERTLGSWDPRQLVEQAVPLAFGRVDRTGPGAFWGHRFHTGALPFYLTLYPGLLAFGLAAAAGGGRSLGGGAGWALVGSGLFLALGRFNPLLAPLLAAPGAGLLRFPVKAWLLVALGLAVLAAAGWQRLLAGDPAARRRWTAALALLGGALAAGAVAAAAAGPALARRLAGWLPAGAPADLAAGQAARWAVGCGAGALVAAALLLARRLAASRPSAGAVLLLGTHAVSQLALLGPATLATDAAAAYRARHPFAAEVPAGSRVVHGTLGRLFGRPPLLPPPGGDARWLARQGAAAAQPLVGVGAGWRYELASSPEGLDGFLTRLAADAVRSLPDAQRIRLLRAWGVEALILERPLAAGAAGVSEVASVAGPLAEVRLYRLAEPAAPVRRVHAARWAAEPGEALAALLDPGFDPGREVVLAGAPPAGAAAFAGGGGGGVAVRRETAEELLLATTGDRPGWVVVERSWQPQWRAEVAGSPAAVLPANLHRIAVAVPAGESAVRLWVDRRPLMRAGWAAAAGALALLGLAAAGRRRPPSSGSAHER